MLVGGERQQDVLVKTSLFDYDLPQSSIAQQPVEPRDQSRLMILHRTTGQIEHRYFHELGEYLHPGDLLIANNSRVIPARLHGYKPTGGQVEIFLLRRLDEAGLRWECMVRGRKLIEAVTICLEGMPVHSKHDDRTNGLSQDVSTVQQIVATIAEVHANGLRTVHFTHSPLSFGEIPLPPYITEYQGDRERYQTIYSRPEGSAAAPTAGLHFTPELLLSLRKGGVDLDIVTLHVGLDTFKPVSTEEVEEHQIHSEWAELSSETAQRINQTTLDNGRIFAIGTTSARTLEWAVTHAQGIDPHGGADCPWQRVVAFRDNVDLFIRPGYRFRGVDALITNFHLPRSSLLMMVSAFVGQGHDSDLDQGRKTLLGAYEIAKRERYRFYSFGDAMLIL